MEYKNQKLENFEKNLKNQKVAVIGLGVSNIPLIDYLYKKQANVTVFDDREEEKIDINKQIDYSIEEIKLIEIFPKIETIDAITEKEKVNEKVNLFGRKKNAAPKGRRSEKS